MNQQPKVSVIIPFYNRLEWTHDAVKSVLGQTLQDFEIILIDDGSTQDYAQKYKTTDSRIRYFRQKNKGPSAARNMGINEASGDYVAFLDSDDLFLADKLKTQIDWMDQNNATITHTSYWQVSSDLRPIQIMHSGTFSGNVYPKIILECPIATPTVIVRRDIIKKFMFIESIKIAEDNILWAQIAKEHKIHGIDIPLTEVRIHGINAAFDERVQFEGAINRFEFLVRRDKTLTLINRQSITSHFQYIFASKLWENKSYRMALKHLFLSITNWPFNFKIYRRILAFLIRGKVLKQIIPISKEEKK